MHLFAQRRWKYLFLSFILLFASITHCSDTNNHAGNNYTQNDEINDIYVFDIFNIV